MFTGLITDIGTVRAADLSPGGELRVTIATAYPIAEVLIGESIAVNGCCLTVVEAKNDALAFTLSAETLACTAPRWQEGARVNLERALQAGDRLGGHFVTGHVDGMARIMDITPAGASRVFTVEAPKPLQKFIAPKGSVTLEGVSLTVNAVEHSRFSVNIIPHTLAATTLGERKTGDALNLEIDLLARYLARLQEAA